jgi:hypothetical protein
VSRRTGCAALCTVLIPVLAAVTTPAALRARQSPQADLLATHSFFLEEAFNQPAGMLLTFADLQVDNLAERLVHAGQRLSFGRARHQLSYSAVASLNSDDPHRVEYVEADYRYQFARLDGDSLALSARATLRAHNRSSHRLGGGAALSLSYATPLATLHLNAGWDQETVIEYNNAPLALHHRRLAGSVVVTQWTTIQPLLEIVVEDAPDFLYVVYVVSGSNAGKRAAVAPLHLFNPRVVGEFMRSSQRQQYYTVSPGLRAGRKFGSTGLVLGLAAPITRTVHRGIRRALFSYIAVQMRIR